MSVGQCIETRSNVTLNCPWLMDVKRRWITSAFTMTELAAEKCSSWTDKHVNLTEYSLIIGSVMHSLEDHCRLVPLTAGEVLFYSLIIGSVMYSSEDHYRLVPLTAGEVLFYSLIIGSVMYSSEDHCRLVPLTAGEVFISNIPQTLSSWLDSRR